MLGPGVDDELAIMTIGPEDVRGKLWPFAIPFIRFTAGIQPPLGPVLSLRRIGRGRRAVSHPTLGQQTLALPHAILQVEQTKASIIASSGLDER